MIQSVVIFSASIWLLLLAYLDWRYRRLPNWLTIGGALCFLLLRLLDGGIAGAIHALIGGVVGGAFLIIPFLLRGAGAGDVKMLFATGCLLGFPAIILSLVYTTLFGFILGVGMMLNGQCSLRRLKHWFKCCTSPSYDRKAGAAALPPVATDRNGVPFGCAIAAGTLCVFLTLWGMGGR